MRFFSSTTQEKQVCGQKIGINLYAFGGAQPGRTYNLNTYRFSYQGQENAVNSNWQAFDLRMHNSDLGRWFAPDPYGQFYSPYVSMGNNPVSGVDPDGGYMVGGNSWGGRGVRQSHPKSDEQRQSEVDQWFNDELARIHLLNKNGYLSYSELTTLLNEANRQLGSLKSGIFNEGKSKDDNFSSGGSAFGAIGSSTFSSVDAPRSATEARANDGLQSVMSANYESSYDVNYTTKDGNSTIIGNFGTEGEAVEFQQGVGHAIDAYYAPDDASSYSASIDGGGGSISSGSLIGPTFEGTPLIANPLMHNAAFTLPGVGIIVASNSIGDKGLLQHEFGHILQARKWGNDFYYNVIGPISVKSYNIWKESRGNAFDHDDTWTEWSATRLSWNYFGRPDNFSPGHQIFPNVNRAGAWSNGGSSPDWLFLHKLDWGL